MFSSKRIFALLLCILLLGILWGCGGTSAPAEGDSASESPEQTAPETETGTEAEPGTELSPEEAFRLSMPGDYHLLEMGQSGTLWGDGYDYTPEHDRLMELGGSLTLREDGTGSLVFDEKSHELAWHFDQACLNYDKDSLLPASYLDELTVDGEATTFDFSRKLLRFEYAGWVLVFTSMTDEEYAEYLASFDVLPEGGS